MIVIPIVVVLVIIGIVVVVVRSKGASSSDDFLSAEPSNAARTDAPSSTGRVIARSPGIVPTSTPDPTPSSAPVGRSEPAPVDEQPDELSFGRVPVHEVDLASLVFDGVVVPTEPMAEPVAAPVHDAPVDAPAPTPESDRPEPMVRGRISPSTGTPTASPTPDTAPHDDDDRAVLSRFDAPGARVASIDITPVAPVVEPSELVGSPEPSASTAHPEVAADPIDADRTQPEPGSELAADSTTATELDTAPATDTPDDPATEIAPSAAPEADATTEADTDTVPADDDALEVAREDDAAAPHDDDTDVDGAVDAPAALTGAAAMSPVLEDPIVLTDEPALPVARLQPEPELDPVDHVLKALISRAKDKQVGIAEVAAELVEQANLEDRDIDEVLADLVVRADDDHVDPSERLEELTLFNDSVPRRPGQLTDFDRLDKNARKKVIIRVLCLLVAMQEDNRLKPSEPRSEAETRHWPLARAVWPVPVADDGDGDGDETEGDKKLPGRRLARASTKR